MSVAHLEISKSRDGSSVKIGTIQRRLAWPLRKDDTLHRALHQPGINAGVMASNQLHMLL